MKVNKEEGKGWIIEASGNELYLIKDIINQIIKEYEETNQRQMIATRALTIKISHSEYLKLKKITKDLYAQNN